MMAATAVASAVTVERTVAVLGEPGQMIDQLDGEIPSPVVPASIMFPDDLQARLMEDLPMVGERVTEGGVTEVGSGGSQETFRHITSSASP